MAHRERVRELPAADRGPAPLHLERGSADRQRPAGDPPRPRPHLQGHVPPLQDHARLPLPAPGGMGHPRPARRARDREGARDLRQDADRARGRGRGVHPAVPRVGHALHRRLGAHDRAHGLLGGHGQRLLHPRQRLHRVGLASPEGHLGPGPPLPRVQGGPLRPPDRGDPVVARGVTRLPGGRGPVHLRSFPGRGRAGRRLRAGRERPREREWGPGLVSRLDHHPLDPSLEPRPRRPPGGGLRVRAGRRRDPHPRRGEGRSGARGPGGGRRADREGPRARGDFATSRRSTSSRWGRKRPMRPTGCGSRTS